MEPMSSGTKPAQKVWQKGWTPFLLQHLEWSLPSAKQRKSKFISSFTDIYFWQYQAILSIHFHYISLRTFSQNSFTTYTGTYICKYCLKHFVIFCLSFFCLTSTCLNFHIILNLPKLKNKTFIRFAQTQYAGTCTLVCTRDYQKVPHH